MLTTFGPQDVSSLWKKMVWSYKKDIHSNRSFLKIMATANIFLNNRFMHDFKDYKLRRQSTYRSTRQKCTWRLHLGIFVIILQILYFSSIVNFPFFPTFNKIFKWRHWKIFESREDLLVAAKLAEYGEIFCYFLHRKANTFKMTMSKLFRFGGEDGAVQLFNMLTLYLVVFQQLDIPKIMY